MTMVLFKIWPVISLILGAAALPTAIWWFQVASTPDVSAPRVQVVATTIAPDSVTARDIVTISTTLRNESIDVEDLTVELEVRGENGTTVYRVPQRGISLPMGGEQSVHWVWRIPDRLISGSYVTRISVFGPNWSPLYARSDYAGDFVVRSD